MSLSKTYNAMVTELYNKLDLSDYRFKLMQYESDLPLIKQNKYLISPNYVGKRVFIVFFKIMGKYMSYMIDRNSLSYTYDKLDESKIKIYPFKIRVKKEAYQGTIFDGFSINDMKNKKIILMINDAYYINGKDLVNLSLLSKLSYIKVFWENMIIDKYMNNNINIEYNEYYDIKKIRNLIYDIIPKHKNKHLIKGVSLVPEIKGVKLIYMMKDNIYDKIENKIDKKDKINNNKNRNKHKEIKDENYEIPENVELTAIFQMKKTDIIDVYGLYLAKIDKEKKKAILKYYDDALILGIEGTKFCKNIFSNKEKALVLCKYDVSHNKWKPIKDMTNKMKYPDKYKKIINKLKEYKGNNLN